MWQYQSEPCVPCELTSVCAAGAAATYLMAAPATGTPPHSVGGTALVLRTDLRDFPLPEYQRWWEFLSGTLLPLYVIRSVRG